MSAKMANRFIKMCLLGRNCLRGSMLKGVESTPTTQKTDLLDDDTSQRRSLSSEHGSLAQKHLHF